MHLRPGEKADLPVIETGERSYIRAIEPEREAQWLAALERNRELWTGNLAGTVVLEVDEMPVGYVMWSSAGADATVVTISVSPEHRGRGLGRKLLEACAEQASAAGHRTLHLGVHRDNPALRLYTAAGFEPTGTDGDYLLMARAAAACT